MVWTDCAPDRGGALSFLLPENLDQQALSITFTTIKIISEEPNG
jgi:hypothetical protein